MTDDARDEADRFAVRQWSELARTGWLLTGDRALARSLADEVLAEAVGQWQRVVEDGAPTAHVRRRLIERAGSSAGPVEPGTAAPAPATSVFDEERPDPARVQREALRVTTRAALLALPLEARAVLALTHGLGLTGPEVAQVLSASAEHVDDVRTGAEQTVVASLRAVPDPDATAGETPSAQVRRALLGLADDGPEPAHDVLARLQRIRETGRRRTLVRAGSALAAAAVLVGALFVTGVLPPDPPPATTDTARAAETAVDPDRWQDPRTWPARGDLAGDQALLDEVAAAHPGTTTLYAGTDGDQQVLVLWNTASELVEGYRATRGTPVNDLTQTNARSWREEDRQAIAVQTSPRSLLVLARPEVTGIEVSDTATVTRAGEITRDWVPLQIDDGLATAVLSEDSHDRLVATRLTDGDASVPVLTLDGGPTPSFTCEECGGDDAEASFAAVTRNDVASLFGIPVDQVTTRIRWSGPADSSITSGSAGQSSQGTLFVALSTLPGGSVVRSAQVSWTQGDGTFVWTVEQAAPVPAADVARAPFALRGDRSVEGLIFQVVAEGASSATLLDDGSTALSPSQPIKDDLALMASATPEPPTRILLSTAAGGRVWPFSILGANDPLIAN